MTSPTEGKADKRSREPSAHPLPEQKPELGQWFEDPSLREHIRSMVADEVKSALASPPPGIAIAGRQSGEESQRLQLECEKTLAELNSCTATVRALEQKIRSLDDEHRQLQNQLQRASSELAEERARHSIAPELTLVRRDLQLAQDMGLADLPDDNTQALIQTVAVLAQLDSLKRLWGVLKDRCEAGKRQATTDERALLQAALAWHNYNWRSQPYRLIDAAAGSGFNYVDHQRSRHVTKGETVTALQLPGIADGNGKALCKALVTTR